MEASPSTKQFFLISTKQTYDNWAVELFSHTMYVVFKSSYFTARIDIWKHFKYHKWDCKNIEFQNIRHTCRVALYLPLYPWPDRVNCMSAPYGICACFRHANVFHFPFLNQLLELTHLTLYKKAAIRFANLSYLLNQVYNAKAQIHTVSSIGTDWSMRCR